MDAPKGYKRGEDGVLRFAPFRGVRSNPNEAVKEHNGEFVCTKFVSRSNWRSSACGEKAKHDPDHNGNPTRCSAHCQAAVDRRKAKVDARFNAWRAEVKRKTNQAVLKAELHDIVRKIAEGHNDPRGLCADWLERWKDVE